MEVSVGGVNLLPFTNHSGEEVQKIIQVYPQLENWRIESENPDYNDGASHQPMDSIPLNFRNLPDTSKYFMGFGTQGSEYRSDLVSPSVQVLPNTTYCVGFYVAGIGAESGQVYLRYDNNQKDVVDFALSHPIDMSDMQTENPPDLVFDRVSAQFTTPDDVSSASLGFSGTGFMYIVCLMKLECGSISTDWTDYSKYGHLLTPQDDYEYRILPSSGNPDSFYGIGVHKYIMDGNSVNCAAYLERTKFEDFDGYPIYKLHLSGRISYSGGLRLYGMRPVSLTDIVGQDNYLHVHVFDKNTFADATHTGDVVQMYDEDVSEYPEDNTEDEYLVMSGKSLQYHLDIYNFDPELKAGYIKDFIYVTLFSKVNNPNYNPNNS